MFINLLTNACIAFTGLYLISKIINYSTQKIVLKQFVIGGLSGLLGIFLIHKGFTYAETVRIDFRYLSLILLGFYQLKSPLIISAIIISLYRFTYGFNFQSVIACCAIFLIVFGFLLLYKIEKINGKSFLQEVALNTWAVVIAILAIFINSEFSVDALSVMGMVFIISLFIGILITLLNLDIHIMNSRINEYKTSSETDHLTGLANKRSWEIEIHKIALIDKPCNVLLLDIDHFKKINDTYGHVKGDEILRQFSVLLLNETRELDVKARIGGEEFGILIADLSSSEAYGVAERIREIISKNSFKLTDGTKIQISTSIGIANGRSKDILQLIDQADQCLYTAKSRGRNVSCMYELISM
ncbi:GGDEF domain-containing protein [Exiguobacterium oxidotolerans]|uniref:GGDEF domain-containing protein n=1 Tax=Exiguobacterium oxidotolerans TaxID=223958 RepID=UPI000689D5B2|nr:GGDEF domain-containing protein [Exiguobacterium oxidotolerans]